MPSGTKSLVFNTRERAISTDFNRLQKFKDADLAELMRYMFGVTGFSLSAVGSILEYAPPQSNAVIINGLMVQPQPASLSLRVTPGVMYMNDGAAGADDSNWRFVHDPGILIDGVVTIDPGSGATRIDVISANPYLEVVESDSRDIFNTTTGLFSPVLVNKVTRARLQYHVTKGAPGGGFPGMVTGRVPICVIRVPSTATTLDQCDLWDVRPLAKEAAPGPFFDMREITLVQKQAHVSAYDNTEMFCGLFGVSEQEAAMLKVRGYLLSSDGVLLDPWKPGTAVDSLWAAGLTAWSSGLPWYLWTVFPRNLSGWRMYSRGVPRVPWYLPGIKVMTQIPPDWRGAPLLPIPLPTWTGILGSSSAGCVVASGFCGTHLTGPSHPSGTVLPAPSISDGDWIMVDGKLATTNLCSPAIAPDAPSTGLFETVTWTLYDGIHFPPNAKAIRVEITRVLKHIYPYDPVGPQGYHYVSAGYNDGVADIPLWNIVGATSHMYPTMNNAGNLTTRITFQVDIPTPPFESTSDYFVRKVFVTWMDNQIPSHPPAPELIEPGSEMLRIVGWKVAP